MFERKGTKTYRKLIASLALLSTISVLAGCAGSLSHVRTLRQIQNQFNEAASLENQLRTDPLSADPTMLLSSQPNASYRLVLEEVTKLLEENSHALQADNLLGTAYTIKALSEWRLGEYDAAVRTTGAVSAADIQLFPRDRALITSLRGLIKNDQAFSHMTKKDYAYKDVKTLLDQSVADINQGLAEVPEGNSVQTYLVVARLASLKNWLDLFGDPKTYATEVPVNLDKGREQQEWCGSAKPSWEAFVNEMDRLGTSEAEAAKKWWGLRLAMPGACDGI